MKRTLWIPLVMVWLLSTLTQAQIDSEDRTLGGWARQNFSNLLR